MNYILPYGLRSWELVASIQIAQATKFGFHVDWDEYLDWVTTGACRWDGGSGSPSDGVLQYGDAMRVVDTQADYYGRVLAKASGIQLAKLHPIRFPMIEPATSGGIVLCPFPINTTFQLPVQAWQAIVRHLRSYKVPVRVVGDNNERLDACMFSEAEILCNVPVREKIEAIAQAQVVVGVPNAWTWCATAWQRKTGLGEKNILLFQPSNIPRTRWFPVVDPDVQESRQRWMVYEAHSIQVPILLAALKKLLSSL